MANEAYIKEGTPILISGAAGAAVAWSVEGLTSSNGRVSAQIDLGASPRPGWYSWTCEVQFQATPSQGFGLALYKAGAPGVSASMIDADIGNADAALGDVDMRRNLKQFGYVVSENAAAGEVCRASGEFFHTQRYLSLVAYNDSGATVNATDTNFVFYLTPISWQAQ